MEITHDQGCLSFLLITCPSRVVCSFHWSHEFPVLGVYKCILLSYFFAWYSLFQWKLILLKTWYICSDHLLLYISDFDQCKKVCPLYQIQLTKQWRWKTFWIFETKLNYDGAVHVWPWVACDCMHICPHTPYFV